MEIVEDAGISAKNIDGRPGFQRALATVLSDGADALIVYKLDRAFRSTINALEIAQQINQAKKGLHSITERIDTTSAFGEFFFTILAALAQMERKLIGERTSAAMRTMVRNGEKVGAAPYGYRWDDHEVVPDEREQECLTALDQICAAHPKLSLRKIAARLSGQGFTNRKGREFDAKSVAEMRQQLAT